jgi:hypothetical protein
MKKFAMYKYYPLVGLCWQQWPCYMRRALFSTTRTLEPWVRITLRTCLYFCVARRQADLQIPRPRSPSQCHQRRTRKTGNYKGRTKKSAYRSRRKWRILHKMELCCSCSSRRVANSFHCVYDRLRQQAAQILDFGLRLYRTTWLPLQKSKHLVLPTNSTHVFPACGHIRTS